MKKIFEEYGGVIHVALAVVALVVVVAILVGGANGGVIGGAFKGITDKFMDKTSGAMDAVSVSGSGSGSGGPGGGDTGVDEDVPIIFNDWEVGDIKGADGLDYNNPAGDTVIRTAGYHQLPYDTVVVTPSNGYKCAYRYYTKSGETYTHAGSFTATTEEFTVTPNADYYYRFVITTTSGELADTAWADMVTIVSASDTIEDVLSPDYELINLPSEVGEWQSIVKVGNEIWLCDESSDGHGALDGVIYRLNASDYSYVGQFVHNLGHLNSTDYDAANDRLITASASNDANATPKVWVFENVSTWTDLDSRAELVYANLDAMEFDLSSMVSTYGGLSYVNACWGERNASGDCCVYVNAGIGTKWFKIHPTVENGSYTGSYTVDWYKSYTTQSIPNETSAQVLQDMELYNGKIIAAITHTPATCGIWEFTGSNTASRNIIKVDWDLAGANEGLMVMDDYVYVGISQAKKLCKFKLSIG